MKIIVLDGGKPEELEPITCSYAVQDIPVAGKSLKCRLEAMFATVENNLTLSISPRLFPSAQLIEMITSSKECVVTGKIKQPGVNDEDIDAEPLAWISQNESMPSGVPEIIVDNESVVVSYPWDVLAINEKVIAKVKTDVIEGTVRENVVIDGNVEIGEGTVLLPGVYIEGNAIIGKDCKIGPNCYIRGNTYIGNGCHVGQAVEVKNSMLMDKVAAGHLSYVGDTIVCPRTNFGAGTIISNFRHDGKNHHSRIKGKIIDTGRRKFGSIIGENVHTGIHTSIYCGRKIWKDCWTLPGDVVKKDVQ